MRYLIDKHALIWFINGESLISVSAQKAIEANDSINFVSIASLWEIAIKLSLGKLELKIPLSEVKTILEDNGFELLPITFEDTTIVSSLPFIHRDPFDRIIIAQGISNDCTVISKDTNFASYNVKVLW